MKVLGCPYFIWTSDEMSLSVMSGQPKRAQRAVPVLSWLTPLAALVSVINVTISMCSADELEWHCFSIDYFAKDRYTPEISDSTMAIPYAVTKAGPLFIVASFLLLCGILSALFGHIWRSRRIATFVAGIIFIVAGLLMLIGLVVYLSVLQSEIGPKLRPRNSLEEALFKYYYGFGFILIVIGFMSTEMTGICAIFWYIYWHQLDWAQKAGAGSCNNVSGRDEIGSNNYSSHHRSHHFQQSYGYPSHYRQQTSRQMGNDPHHISYGDPNSSSTYYSYTKVNSDHCKRHGGGGGSGSQRCNLHPDNYGPGFRTTKYPGNASRHQHHPNHFYYDDDSDMDVPFPPPPPFPRDITCTTTVSADEFFGDHSNASLSRVREREREHRKTTPV